MTRWIVPVLLLILTATPVLGLTVSDVIEMTQAGLGDDVIINQIRATHSHFDLTVDEIIALSRAGISDSVLSYMIATAFDEEAAPAEEYSAAVEEEEPAKEACTFIHLSTGYYQPWAYVWWDYWWPPFDYYWYAGGCCSPAWVWRYRPWCYTSNCWWWYDDWCRPCGWSDCGRGHRYCDLSSPRDRVRWKSMTPSANVTLANSRTRTKAIRDADRGKVWSPLARLEPARTKTLGGSREVLAGSGVRGAKTYRSYGSAVPVSNKRAMVDRSGTTKGSNPVRAVTSRTTTSRTKASPSQVSITKTRRAPTGDRSGATVRSGERKKSSSGSSATIRSKSSSSGRSSSGRAPRSSVGSSSGSKHSSPAGESRSKGGRSGGSSGGKGRR